MVISSLAIEEQDLDLNMLNLGKKGEKTEETKDLLLVIEGSLTQSMMSALTNLLEYNTFVIKEDGQPVQKSRNIKVVIETTSIASLDPTISSFFKMHHCSNKGMLDDFLLNHNISVSGHIFQSINNSCFVSDVSWRMMLSSKLKTLLRNRPKLAQKQEMILESSDQYVEYILKCRKKMGFSDTNIKLYQQVYFNENKRYQLVVLYLVTVLIFVMTQRKRNIFADQFYDRIPWIDDWRRR